jgi:hypothetical protein
VNDETNYEMGAVDGGIGDRNNRIGCFAENGLHPNRQRSEDVLLRKAEERKASVRTHRQNNRQVLLQRDVNEDN